MGENISDKPEVLVVDDSRVIRHAATKMLGADYTVHMAENGMAGWATLQQNDAISVAFVDMQMPEMNGLELLSQIRSAENERLASLPVIIITGADDTENTKKQIFDAGATDFITKPFDSIDLLSRAKSYARLSSKVVELEKKASHDRITGLFSAAGFEEHGDRALPSALRHAQQLSVVSLEIVDFHQLYLMHGKRIAQQIIVAVARRLNECMRTEDVAARTGVAKYTLLLPLTSEDGARIVVDRVCESVGKLVLDTGREKLRISLAFGLVVSELVGGQAFSDIVARADAVLAHAISHNGAADVGGGPDVVEAVQAPPVSAQPLITEMLVNEALQHVFTGDYSMIPDYLLLPVAERLTPFLEYVNSRSEQRIASAYGTGER
jgi:two-component system, cell cycle response regulator